MLYFIHSALDFMKDVADVLASGIEHKSDVEVLAAELNGIRLTYGASSSECLSYSLPIILAEINKLEGKDAAEKIKNVQKVLADWTSFIQFFLKEERDQMVLINEVEVNIIDNNPRAISFWFKPIVNEFATYTIYKGGTNGQGKDFTIWYRKNIGGTYQLYLRRYVDDTITDSIPINQNWTHFVVNYDGTTNLNLKFFINGKEHLGRATIGTGRTFSTVAVQPEFGHNVDQLGIHRYLDGALDDIRIYNRALTQEEITYLANN